MLPANGSDDDGEVDVDKDDEDDVAADDDAAADAAADGARVRAGSPCQHHRHHRHHHHSSASSPLSWIVFVVLHCFRVRNVRRCLGWSAAGSTDE